MCKENKINMYQLFSNVVYSHGCAFLTAADTLFENDCLACVSQPIVSNYAFAVELMLKACQTRKKQHRYPNSSSGKPVLLKNAYPNPQVHGHELKTVFTELRSDIQSLLISAYMAGTGKELMPDLIKYGQYFTKSRYAFERENSMAFNLTGIRDLAHGVNAAILQAYTPTIH